MNADQIQRLPVKIILAVLIILEMFLIATWYSVSFDNYITVVIIFLVFPLAFFGFHYLRITYREIQDVQRFSKNAYRKLPSEVGDRTEEEVRKLVESPHFKEYEKRKKQKVEGEQQEETLEQRKNREEMEYILAELEQKQAEIFVD